MTKAQIRKLARDCVEAGPTTAFDMKGDVYSAYVCSVNGTTFLQIDADLAGLEGSPVDFVAAEINAYLTAVQ